MTIAQWSTTANNNASGVTNVNWAEGQAPSTVNDSARNMMADVAGWLGQASGAIPEYLTGVAGTNTVTATGPAQMASYVAGQRFAFIPANTNTGATTLNITPSGGAALGAKNVFYFGAACNAGEIRQSIPLEVIYDGTQFNIVGPAMAISTWTPAVGGSATYTTQNGMYTKIGNTVLFSYNLAINAIGSGSTTNISGLPFTCAAGTPGYYHSIAWTSAANTFVNVIGQIAATSSQIAMLGVTGATASVSGVTAVLGNGTTVTGTGHYRI